MGYVKNIKMYSKSCFEMHNQLLPTRLFFLHYSRTYNPDLVTLFHPVNKYNKYANQINKSNFLEFLMNIFWKDQNLPQCHFCEGSF